MKQLFVVVGGCDESPDVQVFTNEKKAHAYADLQDKYLEEQALVGQMPYQVNTPKLNFFATKSMMEVELEELERFHVIST